MDWRRAAGWIGSGIVAASLLAGCGSRSMAETTATLQATESTTEAEAGDVPAAPPPPPDEGAQDELGFSSGGCRSAFAVGMMALAVVLTSFSRSDVGRKTVREVAEQDN
jgi:major membrane immunogen (membrane-anchored lipoprotein)